MRTLMRACVLALVSLCAFAQTNVSINDKPSVDAVEERYFRDGSGNVEYICTALAKQSAASVWTRSSATSSQPNTPASVGVGTLTSIAVTSNVATVTTSAAHGLTTGQVVQISGATVDTDLNIGTLSHGSLTYFKVASTPTSTTFTVTTANVTDGTYTESTLQVSTYAPRTNAQVWAIRKMFYTTTSIDAGIPAVYSNALDKSCALRTSYF